MWEADLHVVQPEWTLGNPLLFRNGTDTRSLISESRFSCGGGDITKNILRTVFFEGEIRPKDSSRAVCSNVMAS